MIDDQSSVVILKVVMLKHLQKENTISVWVEPKEVLNRIGAHLGKDLLGQVTEDTFIVWLPEFVAINDEPFRPNLTGKVQESGDGSIIELHTDDRLILRSSVFLLPVFVFLGFICKNPLLQMGFVGGAILLIIADCAIINQEKKLRKRVNDLFHDVRSSGIAERNP